MGSITESQSFQNSGRGAMQPSDSILRLPMSLQSRLEVVARALLNSKNDPAIDFNRPVGERALLSSDSLSWRIFKNPVTLLIGGLSAVILELAEPAVRAGIWEHSSFRKDPMRRLRRTGLAALVTVYGPESVAVPMIARVVKMHSNVVGRTSCGISYDASDPRLLSWVQAKDRTLGSRDQPPHLFNRRRVNPGFRVAKFHAVPPHRLAHRLGVFARAFPHARTRHARADGFA